MRYFKTSVAKAMRDPISTTQLETCLLLVDVEIDREVLCRWSVKQRAIAEDWAIRLHLNASDNPYVRIPDKPAFVTIAQKRSKKLWEMMNERSQPSLATVAFLKRHGRKGAK